MFIKVGKLRPCVVPLDNAIAEEFFGWRWLAYTGRPTKSHPDYNTERCESVRVRRFFPPDKDLDPQWFESFKRNPVEPATGDEALAYCYCSSSGPHYVPHYSGELASCIELEKELKRRKLLNIYFRQLMSQRGVAGVHSETPIEFKRIWFAKPEQRCIAALAVVHSKYVMTDAEQPA